MKRIDKFDIRHGNLEFHAVELMSPRGTKTFDILAIVMETEPEDEDTLEAPNLTIIDYSFGINLMTDQEIEEYFLETVKKYCEEKEANNK